MFKGHKKGQRIRLLEAGFELFFGKRRALRPGKRFARHFECAAAHFGRLPRHKAQEKPDFPPPFLFEERFFERGVRRDAHLVARAQFALGREVKPPLVRRGAHGAARFLPAAQNFEAVPLAGAPAAEISAALHFEDAHPLADVPLHIAGEQILLPERKALGVISAVEGAGKRGARRQTLAFLRLVQYGAVVADRRRDVLLPPHPALYFQRGDARSEQFSDALADAEIGQRERIGALFEALAVDGIQFAAGLFASAAVAAVVAREGGKIALPRKTGTKRPLHEYLRLDD